MKTTLWTLLAVLSLQPPARAERIEHLYVAHGGNFNCVLSDQGHVKCWGQDFGGETREPREFKVSRQGVVPASLKLPVIDLDHARHGRAVQLALGSGFGCALMADNSVLCWGNNRSGQLGRTDGIGSFTAEEALVPVPLGSKTGKILQLVAGYEHACVLFASGRIKCWGNNEVGQLGQGLQDARAFQFGGRLLYANLGPGVRAVQLAANGNRTCALTTQNQLKCWGADSDNDGNQRPDGSLGYRYWKYFPNPPTSDRSFGRNPDEMGSHLPVISLTLEADEKIERVALGFSHTCALVRGKSRRAGRILCWGNNLAGQLGLGDIRARGELKTDIPSLQGVALGLKPDERILNVEGGANQTCALISSGAVKCWGYNNSGELGIGDPVDRVGAAPDQMGSKLREAVFAAGLGAQELAVGSEYVCVLVRAVAAVKCWGSNRVGQLGLPDFNDRGRAPSDMGANLPYAEVSF